MKEKTSSKNGRSRTWYPGDDPIDWLMILLVSLVVLIWVANAAVAVQIIK